jgi:hypothetical protein
MANSQEFVSGDYEMCEVWLGRNVKLRPGATSVCGFEDSHRCQRGVEISETIEPPVRVSDFSHWAWPTSGNMKIKRVTKDLKIAQRLRRITYSGKVLVCRDLLKCNDRPVTRYLKLLSGTMILHGCIPEGS